MNDPTRANARPDLGATASDELLLGRIRGEYLEMPGLRLTRQQAQRLWGLDDATSAHILHVLVERKFLICAPDGKYVRLTDGTFPDRPLRMAKADIDIDPATLVSQRDVAHRT